MVYRTALWIACSLAAPAAVVAAQTAAPSGETRPGFTVQSIDPARYSALRRDVVDSGHACATLVSALAVITDMGAWIFIDCGAETYAKRGDEITVTLERPTR